MFGLSDCTKETTVISSIISFFHIYYPHKPTSTHLPNEMCKCVSPIEDFPVCVHPGVCNPDLVPLNQLLVWEFVRQVVVV